jgi:aminomethyltransferase
MKLTALDSLHEEFGGKMVSFAGYSMPIKYKIGIIAEHKWVRGSAGFFDISHMGQFKIHGIDKSDLESLMPSNISDLPLYKQKYSILTDLNGGAIDDIMITNMGHYSFLVANGSRKYIVHEHLKSHLSGIPNGWKVYHLEDYSLFALQGPKACDVLERFIISPKLGILSLRTMKFMSARNCVFETGTGDAIECLVTRSGYTGEDGFEISVPNRQAETMARALLGELEVLPIGLGARDSLRLEAGLPLYGHELNESITPVEAGLEWIVRKDTNKFYLGIGAIYNQMTGRKPIINKRVGLIPEGRAPIREGTEILIATNVVVGKVTSGGFSPILNGPIAMGYIKTKYLENDAEFHVVLRGNIIPIKVTKLPFIKKNYSK